MERMISQCLDACSDTWEEEFFDNLGQEDQDEEDSDNEQPSPEFEPLQSKIKSYKEAICHWKICNFSLNLEGVYKMLCKWGILWTIYLLYRQPLQNRPLFMISFNTNSLLFRISFNFVNTCYFFVICSFSP